MASKWRYGCGKRFTIMIPRGFGYREVEVECGSTSITGGVNQCDSCRDQIQVVEPYEDESDMDWFERQSDFEESKDE